MNNEEFIDALILAVHNTSISNAVKICRDGTSGRKQIRKYEELRNWYGKLNEKEKDNILTLIKFVTHGSIFNFLCAIDGVLAMETDNDKGNFKLIFSKNNEEIIINEPKSEYLHDIYQSKVYEDTFGT